MVSGVQQGFVAQAIKTWHQPALAAIDRQANRLGRHPLLLQAQLQSFLDQASYCRAPSRSGGFCLGESSVVQVESGFHGLFISIQTSVFYSLLGLDATKAEIGRE